MSYLTAVRLATMTLIIGLAFSADSRCQDCSYHMLAFPNPVGESFVPQVGLSFSSRLIECYVPQWLQDSIALFLPKWVASSREKSAPIADPEFGFEESAIWMYRMIRFDTSSACVLFHFRSTGVAYTSSWYSKENYITTPIYIVADLASQRYYPVVHEADVSFIDLLNRALDGCGDAVPEELLCRTKFILALEYEDQCTGVVESLEEIAQSYMLFSKGRNLGYVTGDELFLSRPLPDLDDPFYRKEDVEHAQEGIRNIPKDYARAIKPPQVMKTADVDSVRLWVYAYDCGEVAEWVVTYDKMGRLLGLEYAREPEWTISGARGSASPYTRIERERKKAVEQ